MSAKKLILVVRLIVSWIGAVLVGAAKYFDLLVEGALILEESVLPLYSRWRRSSGTRLGSR